MKFIGKEEKEEEEEEEEGGKGSDLPKAEKDKLSSRLKRMFNTRLLLVDPSSLHAA